MKKRVHDEEFREKLIKTLVIVECHGVTPTIRAKPRNPENSVEVVYPTILTANLGTVTNVCGNLNKQAKQICQIVTDPIRNSGDDVYDNGIFLAELVNLIKRNVVDNGDGGYALLTKGTPIKLKLPGKRFQNIELFCPGLRLESNAGNFPVGNTDGVWVCDLVGTYDSTNVTNRLFQNQLECSPRSKKVQKKDLEFDSKLKKYTIKKHSWRTFEGSIATYRDLVNELMKNQDDFSVESTVILLTTCRVFQDDGSGMEDLAVESEEEEDEEEKQKLQVAIDMPLPTREGVEGGSNKKRRYTKRKKYFKSSRKVNKLKIKKRRTRKYKNKK